MTIASGANKIEPASAAVLFLECKRMLYLAELESSELVVLISAAMVCAENVKRFLVATSGDKPSCVNLVSEGR